MPKTKTIKVKSKKDLSDLEILSDFDKLSKVRKQKEEQKRDITPVFDQEKIRKKRKRKKLFRIFFAVFTIFFIVFGYLSFHYIISPALKIKSSTDTIIQNLKDISESLDNKDLSVINHKSNDIREEINQIRKELRTFEFLDQYHQTKGYYDNIRIISDALIKASNLLDKTYPRLEKILVESGFKTENNDLNIGGDDEFTTTLLKELPSYIELYKSIEPDILSILSDVKRLKPDYIPDLVAIDTKSIYDRLLKFSNEFPELSKNILEISEYLPELLGSNKETTYLLVLQNETEMRSSGGILSAFGNVTIQNGEIVGDIELRDTWNLENYYTLLGVDVGYRNEYGQGFLMPQGCGAVYQRSQDSNSYPDITDSLNRFKDYYYWANYFNPTEFPAYDHMIMMNYKFSEDLIELIEPLEVEGYGLVSAENLYELIKNETDDSQKLGDPERKKIIKDIANVAKEKFLELSSERLSDILATLINAFEAKDLAIVSPNEDLQAYLDKFGLSGRIERNFDGDYFHLNEAQNCSLKLNKFVSNEVNMNIDIRDDGTIRHQTNIKWIQPFLYSKETEFQYSILPTFTYRAWIRLMTPKDSFDFSSDGLRASGWFPYRPQNYFDQVMQKQINDNVIQFDHRRLREEDPVRGVELNVSYNVPPSINFNSMGEYRLLIQKHPGKAAEKYNVRISFNGREINKSFNLEKDYVLTFKNEEINIREFNTNLDFIKNIFNLN